MDTAFPVTDRWIILHVGCGHQSTEVLPPLDFETVWKEVRLDIDPSVNPDIVASIVDLEGVPDESVDILFSKHNLEHLWAHEVPACLDAFCRVLKPTGFAIIRVPNFKYIARKVLEVGLETPVYNASVGDRIEPIRPLDMIFGWSPFIQEGNPHMTHKTGFTEETLLSHLDNAGFEHRQVTVRLNEKELAATAMKRTEGNILQDLASVGKEAAAE